MFYGTPKRVKSNTAAQGCCMPHLIGQHDEDPDAATLAGLGLQHRVFADLRDEFPRWLGAGTGMRTFDAGCGAGGVAVAFARRGTMVVAMDPGVGQRAETQLSLPRFSGTDVCQRAAPCRLTTAAWHQFPAPQSTLP